MGSAPASIAVTLADGGPHQVAQGTRVGEFLAAVLPALTGRILGVRLSTGQLLDLASPLVADDAVAVVTTSCPEALDFLRHSAAHVLACAVQGLFPGTQVTIGPVIENGFYYDFVRDGGFTPEDLAAIEGRMQALIDANLPMARRVVTREQAERLFAELGEAYKVEIIASIDASEPLTLYSLGDWVDLCRGPHVPASGYIKAFSLTHTAGAYWRGDETKAQLARIYGTAFFHPRDLKARLAQLEEARRRDHRRIGRDLGLFWFHPSAPATPFFLPGGAAVYGELMALVRRYWRRLGFDEVVTPQLFDRELFATSGHLSNYADNMYFTTAGGRDFGLKPMNCPAHALMYAQRPRSYRDLPLRMADFGRLHRFERSGATAGLTRVRSFCQDDAHIFCREDQIGAEIATQLMMVAEIYQAFGMNMRVGLSTRPERSLGREAGLDDPARASWDALWQGAERRLAAALDEAGLRWRPNRGDGAFYGPKIDCEVEDALGRWHQLGTIQLDFGQPRRFSLSYVDAGGGAAIPVMVHRAVLGTVERFMGVLLEHTGGELPLWLAPEQVRVMAINDTLLPAATRAATCFAGGDLRVQVDGRSEKLGLKIREAELARVPVVAVIGAREAASGQVSLRWRKTGAQAAIGLDQALQQVLEAAAAPVPSPALLARVGPRVVMTS